MASVWPDWAICCALGDFLKHMATFFSSNWPHFCGICEIFHFSSQITATNHDALFQSIYSTLKLMYEIGSDRDILKIQRTRAGSYREEGYDWLLNFFQKYENAYNKLF